MYCSCLLYFTKQKLGSHWNTSLNDSLRWNHSVCRIYFSTRGRSNLEIFVLFIESDDSQWAKTRKKLFAWNVKSTYFKKIRLERCQMGQWSDENFFKKHWFQLNTHLKFQFFPLLAHFESSNLLKSYNIWNISRFDLHLVEK